MGSKCITKLSKYNGIRLYIAFLQAHLNKENNKKIEEHENNLHGSDENDQNTSKESFEVSEHKEMKCGQTIPDFEDFEYLPIHPSREKNTMHLIFKVIKPLS